MDEKTFVCPACGGELEAERIYHEAHHFAIDPATGTIGRVPSQILEGLYEDRYRIACTAAPGTTRTRKARSDTSGTSTAPTG